MAIPLTPFEAREKADWTTRAEEDAWITQLLANTNKVQMEVVGTASGGGPIRHFTLGTGSRHVLFTAQQHGNELSGRDAMLTLLRTWAEPTDPGLIDYLSRVTLHVLPTCHPDNLTERNNPDGINVNRDHVQLTQPESRAIHAVIRDHNPDLIVDWHEFFHATSTRYLTQPMLNINIDAGLRSLSESVDADVHTAASGAGYDVGMYSYIYGLEYFHQNAGARHAVGLLLETPAGSGLPPATRYDMHMTALDAVWRWHAAHVDEVAAACAASRERARTSREPITLQNDTNATGAVIDPLPTGYRVTAAEWEALSVHRDRFGITGALSGDSATITTRQDMQLLVAYLVDPASPQKMASGLPLGVPSPALPIPATGYTLKFRHNGVTYPATLKVKA